MTAPSAGVPQDEALGDQDLVDLAAIICESGRISAIGMARLVEHVEGLLRGARAEAGERIALAIEALPTTRTQAWDRGWDSVSLADALAAARADHPAPDHREQP